jgi:hypothetical protein
MERFISEVSIADKRPNMSHPEFWGGSCLFYGFAQQTSAEV